MARRSRFGSVWHREDRMAWYVKWSHRGRPILRKAAAGGAKSEEAKREARSKLRHVRVLEEKGASLDVILSTVFGEVTSHRMTFRKAAAHYIANGMTDKRPSTVRGDVHRLRVVCRAPWAGKILADIAVSDINRWRHARKRKTSVSTANRDVSMASAVFRFSIEMGWADHNPTRDLQSFSEKGRARDTYMTREEIEESLKAAQGELHAILLCAIHAGLRRGELVALEWRWVDLGAGRITVPASICKTGKPRAVHMTDQLRDTLAALRASRKVKRMDGKDRVFLTPRGKPWTERYITRRVREVFDSLEETSAERRAAFCLHLCRHTFASHLAQRGVSLAKVAQLLGHGTTHVTERYCHLAPSAGREEAEILQRAFGG